MIRSASPLSAPAIRRTSAGFAGVARADRSPARSVSAVPATDSSGRTSPRPISPATSPAPASSTPPSTISASDARPTPARSSESGTNVRTTAVISPAPVSTGTSTARPPDTSYVAAVWFAAVAATAASG